MSDVFTITNTIGLYGFLALIPLILLYLIRPKPIEQTIPSLMFFIKDRKNKKQSAFLRNLLRNLLLFIQILLLAALAFSMTEPLLKIPYNVSTKNSVIIIDVSASMQTSNGVETRFSKAVKEAENYITGKTSIILAGTVPVIVLENGGKKQAKEILTNLKPYDITSNLEAAMFAAENILKEDKAKIVVISDFALVYEQDQPLKAKRILNSKGNTVEFVKIGKEANNIGIIDLDINKDNFDVYIKNYGNEKIALPVKLLKNNKEIEHKLVEIKPKSLEIINFNTPTGVSKVEINMKDDLTVDNYAYISAPLKKKIRVLLITNSRQSFLRSALEASPYIELEIREPPVVKGYDLTHEVIIINLVKDTIVPADVKDITNYISKGHSLIITAGDNIAKLGLDHLLPVTMQSLSGNKTKVCVDVINSFTKRFEEKRCFTETENYFSTIAKNNTVTVASSTDNIPIIVIGDFQNGKVVYYGILDERSSFTKADPEYPIFWSNLINFLVDTEDIEDYNKRLDQTGYQEYTKVGVYEINNKNVALNLLNEKESDINQFSEVIKKDLHFVPKSIKEKQNFNLAIPLIIFALILIAIELFIIKRRGDL
jgi:hypothetical protein